MTDAGGLHPNYAFAVSNVLILVSAWWLVVPRLGTWLTALALVSPLVWWIDKAHADVFTYALLTVALALLTTWPALGVVALGLACSQNPPLAVTLPVVLVAAWHPGGGWSPSRLLSVRNPSLRNATVVAIGLAALPMGVAWAFPGAIVITLAALVALSRRAPRRLLHPALVAGPACAVILLAGFSQSLNINHGATPWRWAVARRSSSARDTGPQRARRQPCRPSARGSADTATPMPFAEATASCR